VTDAYTRYLEGRLRVAFGFAGSPIQIIYKNKSDKNA
jgi:predicted GTPase